MIGEREKPWPTPTLVLKEGDKKLFSVTLFEPSSMDDV